VGLWYVDTSAVAKLLVRESETAALRRFLVGVRTVSSYLLVTELGRFAKAAGIGEDEVDRTLDRIDLVVPSTDTFDTARRLPGVIRSLDAIHVATALEVKDDLDGVVAYDTRLIEAAEAAELRVERPGAD